MSLKRSTIAALIVMALLVVTPVWADSGAEKDTRDNRKVASAEPIAETANSDTAAKENKAEQPPTRSYDAEIEQLREALAEQSRLLKLQDEKLNALTEELRESRKAQRTRSAEEVTTQPLGAVASSQEVDLTARVTNEEKELNATKQETESKIKGIRPLSFGGDIRLRDEPFFGGPVHQSLVRNRDRYRLRFNVGAKLNDDVSGGFSLASGDVNDPISTNQTTNQFYTRKAIALDRAFVNYNPHYFKALTLTGGKFAYPWYNTELTWDKDLNPEGVAQTLAYDLSSTPVLKRIAFVGFELPFAEVAGASLNNKSIVQNVVYGGQLQTAWQFASWLKLSAYGGFYNYHHADSIASALVAASLSNPQTPNGGLLKLNQNSVQNSLTTITKITVVTTGSGVLPTGVTSMQSAQFASKFALFDGIARFDIKTPSERWPVTVIGDYVQNTRACANVGNILAAPKDTATAIFKVVNSVSGTSTTACNSHQRRGYWLEGRVGQAQGKGDWQLAYTRMFIEREAVLGAFNASDIRQNSNVSQHRIEAIYQAHRNVQLAFAGYFGRPLASTESLLSRLQFDLIYKF